MSNLPYDVIDNSLKTIAENMGATVPTKRYATVKDSIAGTLSAMSSAGGGGGSGVMVVTFTGEDYYTMSADKTFAEIVAHVNNGGDVIGKYQMNEYTTLLFALVMIETDNRLIFQSLYWTANQGEGNFSIVAMLLNSNDTAEMRQHSV